jgi:hypothetical protein
MTTAIGDPVRCLSVRALRTVPSHLIAIGMLPLRLEGIYALVGNCHSRFIGVSAPTSILAATEARLDCRYAIRLAGGCGGTGGAGNNLECHDLRVWGRRARPPIAVSTAVANRLGRGRASPRREGANRGLALGVSAIFTKNNTMSDKITLSDIIFTRQVRRFLIPILAKSAATD